ncbi:WD40 repeat-like protein, partial [Aspergillus sclerotioniger CBS 115572]
FRQVVGIVAVLKAPLSIASLSKLIHLEECSMRTRLDSFQSILIIPDDSNKSVSFRQPSFREFLLDPNTSDKTRLSVDRQSTNRELAHTCIEIMDSQHGLRQNICGLTSHVTSKNDVGIENIKECLSAELRYSTRYWVHHLEQGDLIDHNQIHEFLKKHFLHWLEAMSILGHLPDVVSSINVLQHMIQPQAGAELSKFLYDAERFLLKNMQIVKSHPLQLYSSALVFAPEESVIRSTFLHCIPSHFTQLPSVPQNWGANLQTLEKTDRWVSMDHVGYSPDGQLLLSVAHTFILRLWESSTGNVRDIEQARSTDIQSPTLSPDGRLLAADSVDCSVRLWDSLSGNLKLILEGHTGCICLVKFLSNQQLVSADNLGTFKTWDIVSGKLLRSVRLKRYRRSERCLKMQFLPEKNLLAVGLGTGTIQLYDTVDGQVRYTLTGPCARISSLVFSPDGNLLASGSADGTVKFRNIHEGTLHDTWHCHTGSGVVDSVAFSHDGRSLAVACEGGLNICNLDTSSISSTLDSRAMTSVSFSPDGRHVVSAHETLVIISDTTESEQKFPLEEHQAPWAFMELWDVSTGTVQHVLEFEATGYALVTFSPHGRLLAGYSGRDGLMKLWEVSTGKLRHTLAIHAKQVGSLRFSPDESLLAFELVDATTLWNTTTGWSKQIPRPEHLSNYSTIFNTFTPELQFSRDGLSILSCEGEVIKIWNTTDGSLHRTLTGHSGVIDAVAFSPSTDLLASSSRYEKTVRIWNITSGTQERVIQGVYTRELEFSPDGKLLAGKYHDNINVWNVSDGMLQQTLELFDWPLHDCNAERSWFLDPNSDEYTMRQTDQDSLMILTAEWILLGQEKILWIPPEYRGELATSRVNGNTVVMVDMVGHVSFIGLNRSLGG